MRRKEIAFLGLTQLFFLQCGNQEYKEYVYLDEHNRHVSFRDYPAHDKDRFLLQVGYDELVKIERIEIIYRGQFVKDSVDMAVAKYLNKGVIPLKSNLQ